MVFGTDLTRWKLVPFADSYEVQTAQSSPLYASSSAYRQAFAEKLSISPNLGAQVRVGDRPNEIYPGRTPDGGSGAEIGITDADFQTATPEDKQALADLHPDSPLMFDPALKIVARPKAAPKAKPEETVSDRMQAWHDAKKGEKQPEKQTNNDSAPWDPWMGEPVSD